MKPYNESYLYTKHSEVYIVNFYWNTNYGHSLACPLWDIFYGFIVWSTYYPIIAI